MLPYKHEIGLLNPIADSWYAKFDQMWYWTKLK